MATRTQNNTKALYAYIAKIDEIRATLARLASWADANGGVAPEDIHSGHVADVTTVAHELQYIADMWRMEGEEA